MKDARPTSSPDELKETTEMLLLLDSLNDNLAAENIGRVIAQVEEAVSAIMKADRRLFQHQKVLPALKEKRAVLFQVIEKKLQESSAIFNDIDQGNIITATDRFLSLLSLLTPRMRQQLKNPQTHTSFGDEISGGATLKKLKALEERIDEVTFYSLLTAASDRLERVTITLEPINFDDDKIAQMKNTILPALNVIKVACLNCAGTEMGSYPCHENNLEQAYNTLLNTVCENGQADVFNEPDEVTSEIITKKRETLDLNWLAHVCKFAMRACTKLYDKNQTPKIQELHRLASQRNSTNPGILARSVEETRV